MMSILQPISTSTYPAYGVIPQSRVQSAAYVSQSQPDTPSSTTYIRNATLLFAGVGMVLAGLFIRHTLNTAPFKEFNPYKLIGVPVLLVPGSGILGAFTGAALFKRKQERQRVYYA